MSQTLGAHIVIARPVTRREHTTTRMLGRCQRPHTPLDQLVEEQLLDKLLADGPTADLALRDALSRWWESTEGEADAASFWAVSMRIIDDSPGEEG